MSDYGTLAELCWQRKTEILGETALPTSLWPTQYSINQRLYVGMKCDVRRIQLQLYNAYRYKLQLYNANRYKLQLYNANRYKFKLYNANRYKLQLCNANRYKVCKSR